MKYLLFFPFLFLSLLGLSQRTIPPHGGVWVHDEASLLSPAAISQLESILKGYRDSTSNQIALYIIPTLDGDDIDDYANRVFSEWKLGDEKKDNGVLWLIAVNDRRQRIEVGFGLEGNLTDALSSRINRNEVAPFFREGNYDAGIQAGLVGIMKAIQGTYVNEDPPRKRSKKRSPIASLLIIIAIIVLMSRRKGGGGGGGGYWSAAMLGTMLGSGMGRSSGSWGSGGDFGGGGFSGGGGSSDSW
ncbi:MAG: TPM domain-containing protein [Bacteroidia bacterium]|nr:TPM domain-containing protein [Bacteroidia bacterium]